jgi:hypothetical protein
MRDTGKNFVAAGAGLEEAVGIGWPLSRGIRWAVVRDARYHRRAGHSGEVF